MPEPTSHSTRSKILIAAATMLGEKPTSRLSVRAVAARAGVSVGSLRHFFPTQQELIDTVVAALYDLDIPDDPMHDSSVPPAERLVACLQLLLSHVGTGDRARQYVRALHDAYIAAPPSEDATHAFLALERLNLHQITRWLCVLRDERALAADDLDAAARFLSTVVNGLAFERALPGDLSRLPFEAMTLRIAVDSIMRGDNAHTEQP
ncbi:TetR/AcrR family transcriptional regulator [Mycolicibacterium sp. 018/SC-01/001]|uniref:TetR/AcrR family transcriptional regulator n=1 Tax=Mycolicibacterium sp. 018/SC-01/001 TaxID=2592069 RepID=UPI001181042D|nr:TetR/AcrR family transcriptional regulator [Mycolicibacterium sp. 018/SC-01/001]TRW89105.1 TetR/AcrR family transcriptional regulator [Mycolicibacterium sp. 018/SC-01/001]